MPELLSLSQAQFLLTHFDCTRFQSVTEKLAESVFFLLAPMLMLQVRSQTKHLVTSKKNKTMTYSILTDTDFFHDLESGNDATIRSDYDEFIGMVVEQCKNAVSKVELSIMLTYTEAELLPYLGHQEYADKASMFLKKMQSMAEELVKRKSEVDSGLKWTGKVIDLVELVCAFSEVGCINDGEMKKQDLMNAIFPLFGMKPVDYFRKYIDIKGRYEYSSATFFLDDMSEKLKLRIQEDRRKSREREKNR